MTIALVQPASAEDAHPALENPAVARCCEAWEIAYKAHTAKRNTGYGPEYIAAKAFRRAMPPLSGYQNICDFIACVGYGMVREIIPQSEGTRLLYAAQVALGTIVQQAKTQKRGTA